MKTSRLIFLSCACFLMWPLLLDLQAQAGTVNFANGAALVNARMTFTTTGEGVEGSDWSAELLLQSGSNLVHVAGPVSFETGPLAGYFLAGSVPVGGTKPGELASFGVRITNSISLFSLDSPPVTVTLGGEKSPPANLIGLAALELVPLNHLQIDKTGGRVLVSWPKSTANLLLQFSNHLPGPWQNLPQPPLVTNNASISVILGLEANQQFFRLETSP